MMHGFGVHREIGFRTRAIANALLSDDWYWHVSMIRFPSLVSSVSFLPLHIIASSLCISIPLFSSSARSERRETRDSDAICEIVDDIELRHLTAVAFF